jgi:UDP:flavonoid glycosyltransferase YjiC (YdhE family)
MSERGLVCFLSGVNGSTGDVRPLVALALAMRRRGFAILVVGDVAFEKSTLSAGVRESEWFSCSEVPQTFWLRTMAGQRALWRSGRALGDRWLARELQQHWRDRADAFWRMVGGPNNPNIVAAVGSTFAFRSLRRFGPHCPKIISSPLPSQPSKEFTLVPPDRSSVERLHDWIRQRWGATDELESVYDEAFHLVSVSPVLFRRPSDWPANIQVTGSMPLDDDRLGWSPPAQLCEFLAKAPPPVYVGFGQHAVFTGPRGARRADEIVQGCRNAGFRCIIQCPDLVLDGQVSHTWLFPRCAAVVHHGGYGTLHAALIAQRPMIIYPFQTDQYFWAARMGELGVAPGFTARLREVSARRVAADLAVALAPRCAERAAQVGATIASEDGVAVQVAAIESIVEHNRRAPQSAAWRPPARMPAYAIGPDA